MKVFPRIALFLLLSLGLAAHTTPAYACIGHPYGLTTATRLADSVVIGRVTELTVYPGINNKDANGTIQVETYFKGKETRTFLTIQQLTEAELLALQAGNTDGYDDCLGMYPAIAQNDRALMFLKKNADGNSYTFVGFLGGYYPIAESGELNKLLLGDEIDSPAVTNIHDALPLIETYSGEVPEPPKQPYNRLPGFIPSMLGVALIVLTGLLAWAVRRRPRT